jgi:NADPH-dependent 2,4-dienoyl-CoA reductase/sulfur reductase-like enzyme
MPDSGDLHRDGTVRPRQVTVIGASLAGLSTVESLRRLGYSGRVVLVGEEAWLPYDRPPLSKAMLVADVVNEPAYLRTREQIRDLDISWQLGRRCERVDVETRTILLDDGSSFPYETLVVATGARARALPSLDNVAGVHRLRTFDDCRSIAADLSGSPTVVVVGGGFIGCEVAASMRARGLDVTVVEVLPSLLAGPLGVRVGGLVGNWHNDRGVHLICNVGISGYRGRDRVEAIELSDGRVLPADVVVLGLGAIPNTELLRGSGVVADNGLVCDRFGRTAADGIFAVGDVARATAPEGHLVRVEHWTNATIQASAVAHNVLAGDDGLMDVVRPPYFWSDQYGKRLQYIGAHRRDARVHIDEGGDGQSLLAVYERDGVITAALSVDLPRLLPRLRGLLGQPLASHWPMAAATAARRS